jgi:hypothetical protein
MDNDWTRVLGFPGYRVYKQEIDEERKHLKLWIRRKRGNRRMTCAGCGRRVHKIHEVCEREIRDLPCFEFQTTVVVELYRVDLRHSREITLLCSPKVTHHHDQLGGVLPPGKSAVLPPGKSVVLPRGNCSVRACPCPPPQSNRLRRRTVSPATSARYAPLARMM